MALCKFSNDYLMENFTLVDNLFISEYLNIADEMAVRVYLYGLYMCSTNSESNSLDMLCAVLDTEPDVIEKCYAFWQSCGLVEVESKNPLCVKYLSIKRSGMPPKKYDTGKYGGFDVELRSLFPGRDLTENEIMSLIELIDRDHIEREAMLLIVQYCIDINNSKIGFKYISKVAKVWAEEGVKTAADVERKLEEYETQTDTMRQVLHAINRKSGADLEEKQMLAKWMNNWGFDINAITTVAKKSKSRSFAKIDDKLDGFMRINLFSAEEIKDYYDRREKIYTLAVEVNKRLGLFYESLDHIVETYTIPWLAYGFSDEAVLTVAHYCFMRSIRSLDGMSHHIARFAKMGRLTVESINEYIELQLATDDVIKRIIEATGKTRSVTQNDRDFYKIWSADWGVNDDLIIYAAQLASARAYSIPSINQLLSLWRSHGIDTVEKAKAYVAQNGSFNTASSASAKKSPYVGRTYSSEELAAAFSDSDDDI